MVVGNHTLPTNLVTSCGEGTLYCFAEYVNNVTNPAGLFWVLMLMAFSVVLMMASTRLGSTKAFGFGSFVGMIGAIWLATMSLMDWAIASAFIIVGLIGIAAMILEEVGGRIL
jgi:hypothetical protein